MQRRILVQIILLGTVLFIPVLLEANQLEWAQMAYILACVSLFWTDKR
jgi:hypothetical protein